MYCICGGGVEGAYCTGGVAGGVYGSEDLGLCLCLCLRSSRNETIVGFLKRRRVACTVNTRISGILDLDMILNCI